ncbi:MAG TPA: hypothetical protein VJ817_15575 [Gemmatimonadales bacterium]|nr:hypothetical protein [Gemmatimonadales bacterium]
MDNRTVLNAFSILGVMALSGCGALTPSQAVLPVGAVPVAASATYREWFARTEACSGRTGSLATVQFYVVPGVETFETRDGPQVGVWIGEGASHRIVIAGNYQGNEMVVRHELLHTLLRQTGHPEEYFVNRCRLTWESWNSGH